MLVEFLTNFGGFGLGAQLPDAPSVLEVSLGGDEAAGAVPEHRQTRGEHEHQYQGEDEHHEVKLVSLDQIVPLCPVIALALVPATPLTHGALSNTVTYRTETNY